MWAAETGSAAEVVTLGGGHRGHSSRRSGAGAEMIMMVMMMMVMMVMVMVMMPSSCDNLPLYHPEHKQKLKIFIYIDLKITFAMKISNLNRLNFSTLSFWLIREALCVKCIALGHGIIGVQ